MEIDDCSTADATPDWRNRRAAGFSLRVLPMLWVDSVTAMTVGVIGWVTITGLANLDPDRSSDTALAARSIVVIVLSLAYFGVTVGVWGTSLGKRIFKLRVVRTDGSRVGILRALSRSLAYIVSAIPLGAGFFVVGIRSDNRALHDLICDTKVISTRSDLEPGGRPS